MRHFPLLSLLLLIPSAASAAVWGGFDASRVNYSGGIIATGDNHDTFRDRLALQGDTVAAPTGLFSPAYLNTVDVFYTSLANSSASPISSGEQLALSNWVAAGGVFIISADIFNEQLYNSYGAAFGIGPFVDSASSVPATTNNSHPLISGISTLGGVTHSVWTSGPNGLVLATNPGGTFVDVYDASTGFTSGGAVLVLGDHNFLTDSFIGSNQN